MRLLRTEKIKFKKTHNIKRFTDVLTDVQTLINLLLTEQQSN